jgi:hypothetical protein
MTDIATIDIEISRLQAEAAAVERAGPTFEERWPAVEAELAEAERIFREIGPQLGGVVSQLPEHVEQRRRAMVGAAVVANRKALIDSERSRIKVDTEGGIAAPDKARRLEQLRSAVLRAAAQRELLLRDQEVVGEFRPRPVHAELAVCKRSEIERLAAAR